MSSSNIITAAPTEGQDKSQSSHFNANATFNYTQQTLLLCTPKSITLKPRTQMCSNLSVSHMNPSTWQVWHIRSLIQQHGRCTGAVTVLLFKFSFMFSRFLFCFPAVSCSPHSLVFPPLSWRLCYPHCFTDTNMQECIRLIHIEALLADLDSITSL